MHNCPQDLLVSFFLSSLTNHLFGLGCGVLTAPFLQNRFWSTKSVESTVWSRSLALARTLVRALSLFLSHLATVAVHKLWCSREVSLSIQFLIHTSSSPMICVCLVWLVWLICVTPSAFLTCAASVPERVLAEPFWKARDLPKGVFAINYSNICCQKSW